MTRWFAVIMICSLGAFVPTAGVDALQPDTLNEKDLLDSGSITIVKSYYQLPAAKTVVKKFARDKQDIVEQFNGLGIQINPLTGKEKKHGYGFVGPSLVVSDRLHGTADAPFSRTKFSIQHPAGIELKFNEPKSFVGMTLVGPTTNTDIGLEMKFFDQDDKLIKTINADTKHRDKQRLGFDSRGAVFRGLMIEESKISSVHIVPTRIPEKCRIVLASVDYLCYSNTESAKQLEARELAEEEIRQLVRQLDSSEYEIREKATRELLAVDPIFIPILQSLSDGPTAEARARLGIVLQNLQKKGMNLTPNGNEE